ncbi:hypothetical protein BBP40_000733 [Aspergillus hancockii]|nr:hypothetical protein BBP40_000733 [Aspergillus hancockii]
MQTVAWASELGSLAQHGLFLKEVKSLLDEKFGRKFLWGQGYLNALDWSYVDQALLNRDLIRSSTFRVSKFGAEEHTEALDSEYLGRDRHQDSKSGLQASISSDLIYNEQDSIYYSVASPSTLWGFLSKASCINGPDEPFPMSELGYDAQFLHESDQSMSKYWLNLHIMFSKGYQSINKYKAMMWVSTLAFADNANMPAIQTLITFLTIPSMVRIQVPQAPFFQLSDGSVFLKRDIQLIIESYCRPMSETPEATLLQDLYEGKKQFRKRQTRLFVDHRTKAVDELASQLMSICPHNQALHYYNGSAGKYIYVEGVVKPITEKFTNWSNNKRLLEYLEQVVAIIGMYRRYSLQISWSPWPEAYVVQTQRQKYVSVDDVLASNAPSTLTFQGRDLAELILKGNHSKRSMVRFSMMLKDLDGRASSRYEKAYVRHLRGSLERLEEHFGNDTGCLNDAGMTNTIHQHMDFRKQHLENIYNLISTAAGPGNLSTSTQRQICLQIVADANVWPRVSPSFFLEQLKHCRFHAISNTWKESIINYGLALTRLQRARRLLECVDNRKDLGKELQNPGHKNWNPHDLPDSLLLEVESGMMIRGIQENIAQNMRTGQNGKNTVMQLNMGEGKSSVIVPIVASSLADGSRLVRVIVAKPQAKQMFQMLISKVAGMLERRIYHLPFSRALTLNNTQAKEITLMFRECMQNGGILLVQPEQILSLKLMALECCITGKSDVAQSLLETLIFLEEHSRDIVDESDENFSVNFELVYTMGDQHPVQLSPERWMLINQVLELVRTYSPAVKKNFPFLEIDTSREGSFPRTRVFEVDAQHDLLSRIATHICDTGLSGFPIARQPETVRQAVYTYITEFELTSEQIQRVEKGSSGFWGDTTRDVLFLLRGLLAGGILAFVFGVKRWRVNYGLTTTREPPTKLAVPYRAKDNPTARSEFSHPDVVIILTSLSYYYGGLSDDDLFLSFSHVLKSDQAEVEYQLWVKDAYELPKEFQRLVSINLEDRYQCINKIFPSFQFSKSAVDYFLSHIVFPKEMKGFPYKLSASGWDIGQEKRHPTTGFSGTNDSREVLPLSVEQLDLPEQEHTNALVLEYLMQPENSVVSIPPKDEKQQSDAEILLSLVMKMTPPAQVILDVGAQVLELTNEEVASEWIRLTAEKKMPQAVVFCDDDDEICVMDRKGQVELLQTSPFAKQLDMCHIFLDEAHTRGIDLKLPEYYKAAVTLGPNLTKDRLVQACMRMRKLGHGQSVIFCVPDEIQHRILMQGCNDRKIEGQRFLHHERLWNEARIENGISMSSDQARKFLEDEALSLEERYRPQSDGNRLESFEHDNESHAASLIAIRCREFDHVLYHTVRMNEEQERELSPEVQQEREVQKPPKARPMTHIIHPDLKKFISSGLINKSSETFQPAFQSLAQTSAATYLDVHQFPGQLLVTRDFSRTIQLQDASLSTFDAYQRPVQWVLMSCHRFNDQSTTIAQMVIISPYEVQELYESIRVSEFVTLHIYAPRLNLGLQPLDRLDLYVSGNAGNALHIPRNLIIQLNLFAGQLYLRTYEEYVEVCNFLGIAWRPMGRGSIVAADGFILNKDEHSEESATSIFSHSPIPFLKVLMSQIRRSDEGIEKTHLGRMFDGMILRQKDFEEQGKQDEL